MQFIDAHLVDDLPLARLAQVAGVSRWHFQRQFAALFGLGVYEYVQLRRLKRASLQLAFRPQQSVLDIALDCGYAGPEAFARAFRRQWGQSPRAFRQAPQWHDWHYVYLPLYTLRNRIMTALPDHQPDIVERAPTPVAVLAHRGDPARLGETIRQFIAWRKRQHLPPATHATFNVLYNDPYTTPPADYRIDLAVACPHPVEPGPEGLSAGELAGGRYAKLRYVGSDDALGMALRTLYVDWLAQSGETLRDAPLWIERVRFFPDVPEHEAICDIYLPLV
ncbi:AraC family transcriptional regulator [Silvimonas terrae]|uniref:AraC family transcriptional regulator n=1 Tax=Silvimonas terrae TaxID=300266 RepID=A0A840RCB5_9NEIS|nr:AraC family transcriptional regulator [Silvimonas terrae]MBB5190995.1 AraC family transcriptional regulator [Silvimonas terrae]